jgi:hypothetical protein
MPKKEEVKTAKSVVTKKINAGKFGFDLKGFKKTKNLSNTAKFKKQEYYRASPAFQEALSIPGIPKGHITLLRGHSNTGKTTAMVELIKDVQKSGDLPVIIITEMKWSWEHAKIMGLEVDEEVDTETGEITYGGDFIYVDRSNLKTIEDVADFISDLLLAQERGELPVNLCFFWDSIGSIPCLQCYESNKSNAMWNAGAMSNNFGNFVNQRIILSRKDTYKYTNTLVAVNQIRIEYPSTPMEMPKLQNKGGHAMFRDATYIITFGNVKGAGTIKVKAKKNNKEVEWANIVKVSCDKNHGTGIQTSGRIVTTVHGFITNEKKEIDRYKKEHSNEWANILGSSDFEIVQEEDNTDATVTED